jgi:hypothetical protein
MNIYCHLTAQNRNFKQFNDAGDSPGVFIAIPLSFVAPPTTFESPFFMEIFSFFSLRNQRRKNFLALF